jgi:hypothetical protein
MSFASPLPEAHLPCRHHVALFACVRALESVVRAAAQKVRGCSCITRFASAPFPLSVYSFRGTTDRARFSPVQHLLPAWLVNMPHVDIFVMCLATAQVRFDSVILMTWTWHSHFFPLLLSVPLDSSSFIISCRFCMHLLAALKLWTSATIASSGPMGRRYASPLQSVSPVPLPSPCVLSLICTDVPPLCLLRIRKFSSWESATSVGTRLLGARYSMFVLNFCAY